MPETFERTAEGVQFIVEDRRYRILSPLQCNARGQVVLTLALHDGDDDVCLHQDQVNTSTAKGRHGFARLCLGREAQVIEQDLLALDDAVRQSLAEEAAQDDANDSTVPPRRSHIEEGDHAYVRLQTKPNGTVERTPVSSFVIVPRMRVYIDGAEAIQADLQLAQQIVSDVTFERHCWYSRGLFQRALPTLDLWCTASTTEIQHIQGLVAGKSVPHKQGTRALGYHDGGYWVTPDGVLDAGGWMADPPVLYLPYGGVCPLADGLRYRMGDPEAGAAVVQAFYERVWSLHAAAVIGPMTGWFFATPFKPLLHRHLGHFPILNCWGTRGGGKTSLLQLFWRLFGVESALLSCTETEFAFLALLAATTSIPLVFDEFKPCDMRPDQVKRFERLLRRVYQSDVEHRGRPELQLISYRLTAPVAVVGEVPVATQPALAERVIPVTPAPTWLAARPGAKDAYRQLMTLPLSAFAAAYIPWCLQRPVASDLADAAQILEAVIGLCQFDRFGADSGAPRPASIDIPALLAPLVKQLAAPDGSSRTAVDLLLEQLATLAELGRLQRDVHYTLMSDGHLALRLEACLAEFRRYVRETRLNTEVLTQAAYVQQLREIHEAHGYVRAISERAYFGTRRLRAVLIDRARAEQAGLDLGGFPECEVIARTGTGVPPGQGADGPGGQCVP